MTTHLNQLEINSPEFPFDFVIFLGVYDPGQGVDISLPDALKAGIIDYSRAAYCYPLTGRTTSIPKAIADGHIKVRNLS